MGEYAITKPGGIGVGFALDRRISLTVRPADRLTVTGLYEGKEYAWKENEPVPPSLSLISSVIETLQRPLPKIALHIDTRPFSDSQGNKLGYGSSAAVAAGLVFALLFAIKQAPPAIENEVFPLALEAHRRFQGGRGSGYDLLASLHGGIGRITGGVLPQWEALPLDLPDLYLLRGGRPVATRSAVQAFERFSSASPRFALNYFQLSNELATACGRTPFPELLARAAKLNRWLHRHLKIEAESQEMYRLRQDQAIVKPLGAGGELALVIPNGPAEGLEKITVASEGLQWKA